MIAVQGPNARDKASTCLPEEGREAAMELTPFFAAAAGDLFVARTGYTGEDGWEIILPGDRATAALGMSGGGGYPALWPRRQGYAASGGRHEPLWR